jgi:hypothetical protein
MHYRSNNTTINNNCDRVFTTAFGQLLWSVDQTVDQTVDQNYITVDQTYSITVDQTYSPGERRTPVARLSGVPLRGWTVCDVG